MDARGRNEAGIVDMLLALASSSPQSAATSRSTGRMRSPNASNAPMTRSSICGPPPAFLRAA